MKNAYAVKISFSNRNSRKPESRLNVRLTARTLMRILKSISVTTGG